MLMPINRTLCAPALLALLAGCAGSSPDAGSPATTPVASAAAGGHQAAEGYVLSAQELKLNCRKLSGRMQVRILQIRDHEQSARPSAASRLAQQAATSLYGGPRQGVDPDAEYQRDRAMLEAYNRQLAAKRCKTFDLEAELTPKSVRETPTPPEN
jgi:hypothetical protein